MQSPKSFWVELPQTQVTMVGGQFVRLMSLGPIVDSEKFTPAITPAKFTALNTQPLFSSSFLPKGPLHPLVTSHSAMSCQVLSLVQAHSRARPSGL